MSYVEFPADPVVNVHWRKKKPDDPNDPGDPTDFRQTCGAFQNGILHGLPVGFTGIFVLDGYWLYTVIPDQHTGHLPDKPFRYFNKMSDYNWFTVGGKPPYVWSSPAGGWDLFYKNPDFDFPFRIKEFRNVNIQVFDGTNAAPDQIGNPIHIDDYRADERYPPAFICEFETFAGWQRSTDPHVFIQARCCPIPGASGCSAFETIGSWWPGTDNDPGTPAACLAMLPPQPPGWGTFFDPNTLVEYPAPGSTNDPVKPPPNLRRRAEPQRPAPPVVIQRLEGEESI